MEPVRRGIAASIARIFAGRSSAPPPAAPRKRLVLEPLESRVLLSADPLAAGSLLVIDGALDNQADLLSQFSGSDVLVLDHDRDGVQQISDALAAHDGDIGALHIISHGSSGSLALGSSTLDAASLDSHAAQLRAWAEALTADADILFYGCNVAADEGFVQQLSCLTGADVAASNDLTGSAALGGDWVLEYATGAIEADAVTASIDGVLATVNYDAATHALTFTADAGDTDAVTVSSGPGGSLRIVVGNGDAIVRTGDAAGNANFTLTGTSTLDINRAGAPIAPFNLFLGDQNDTLAVNSSGFNGAVNLTILGEDGTDAVTIQANSLSALTIGAETINVNGNVDTAGSQTYSGAVNMTAGVTLSTGAAGALSFDGSIAAGANTLTLSSGEINLPTAANSVSGTGALTLQPLTDAAPIVIGGGADSGAAALDITDADIAALSGGFASITIGRATGNGAITIDASGASFGDNLTVRAPTAGGTIRVDGVLDTTADPGVAAITLDATTITLHADVVTSGGSITIADPVVLGTPATVTLDTTNGGVVGGANITLSSVNDDTAGSSALVLAGALAIPTGTVTLNTATQASNLILSGSGTLTGSGNVTVTGLTTWTGGTMSGSGTTNTDGGLNISGTAIKQLIGGRTLNTAGTTNWSGSNINNSAELFIQSGASINNNGTWNDQHNFTVRMLNNGSTGGSFDNFGTYTKSGTGETQVSVAFNNTGTVNVDAGRLELIGGGTHTGSFSGTGTLEFSGATHALNVGSSIAMTNVTFTAGTANINGTYAVSGNTTVSGGTANFLSVPTSLGAVLNVSAGTANLGSASVALTTLMVSGGTFTGTGAVSVSGLTTWTGGTMSGAGTLNTDGGLNITGGTVKQLIGGRTLNTAGTTNWSGGATNNSGEIFIQSGASINNNGTWNDQHNFLVRMLNNSGTGGSFDNFGIYTKSGAGETDISVAFNNTAGAGPNVVNVNAGTLALSGGGTQTGSFSGAGTLEFGGGTHALNATSSIVVANATFSGGTANINGSYTVSGTTSVSGGTANFLSLPTDLGTVLNVSAGNANLGNASDSLTTLAVSGGTLTSNGTLTVGAATISAGTLGGTGTVSVSGLTTWTGGTMSGAGTTNTDGGLNISGATTKQLIGGRTLNTAGTTNWSGGTTSNSGELFIQSGASINNNGTWNDLHNFTVRMLNTGSSGSFDNFGTYTKSGTGETDISVAFNNTAGAGPNVVNVNAGILAISGGGTHTGSFSGAGTLEFGGGTHALNATSSIVVGNATFSGGTANINGSYTVTGTTRVSGGTANFLALPTDLGTVLNVSAGAANLGAASDVLTTLTVSGGTLTSNGTLTVGAATISGGTLTGSGTVSISGSTTWTGGTMSGTGTTNTDGGLNIAGPTAKQLIGGRTLNTAGTTNWSGSTAANNGELFVQSGASINNNGTWNEQHNFTVRMLNNGSTGGSFDNFGTYNKNGTGETQISVAFNNAGGLNVNAGTLVLSGGGIQTGGVTTTAGTTLEFGGGSYQLSNAAAVSSLGTLLVSSGTVSTSGTLTTSGLLRLTAGTLDAGDTVDATTYEQTGGTLAGAGTVNVSGQSTWTAGAMTGSGDTNTNGGLNINTAGTKVLSGGRTLNTAATTNWSGSVSNFNGEILLSGGANIVNHGTWNDQHNFAVRMLDNVGAGSFENHGNYNKNGTGETAIDVGFDNTNAVNANAGTLSLDAGGTSSGAFNIAAGATLEFGGGLHALQGSSSVSGVGTAGFDVGTANVAGTYNITGTTAVTGGTANFTGTVTAVGAVTISNGTANFSTGELIQASTLSLSGGGTLSGSDTFAVSGLSTWTGGTMTGSGDTNTNGLNISTNALKNLSGGRTLNTAATTTWSGSTTSLNGEIFLAGGASIVNSGTWNDQHAFTVRMVNNIGGGSFENHGTYNKNGAGETQINVGFDNTSLVNANAGTLSLDGGGASSGAFTTAGGVLEFGGGVHQLQETSSVTSAGTVHFDAGTANIGGTYNVTGTTAVRGSTANFTGTVLAVGALQISNGTANFSSGEPIAASSLDLTGGTLAGTDTVAVTGQSTWTAGTMSGTGQTNTNGGLNITGNANKNLLGGRVLNTAGTTNWSGNTAPFNNEILMTGGSTINNSGSWNDQNAFLSAVVSSGGVNEFNNAGTYTKSGSAETQFSAGFDNSGTARVQAGMLNISGALAQTGTIDVANSATFRKLGGFTNAEGAVISGSGTIEVGTGTLTNSGTIRPGGLNAAGLLSISGDLELTESSVIDFDLAGTLRGLQYDAINVGGTPSTDTALLDGNANIIHLDGFAPMSTDAFVAIQAEARTGIFDSVNAPDLFEYETLYQANFVIFQLSSNDPPVALNDSYSVAEDATLTIAGPGVLANDTDPDTNPITAVLGTGPSHGTLVLNADGGFTYTPTANFSGTDTFTYRASDGQLESDLATVTLTVTPVNDAPVANNDSVATNEDTALTFNVRANDTDIDSIALSVSQFTQGAHGSVSLNASGNFIYTPDANFFGSDTFTYRVRDTALAESNEATVTVTVLPVNDAPDAVNDSYTIDEDTVLSGALANVLANDTDVDNATLTAQLVTGVSHGTLALNSDGTFTYTPDADFFGTDTFQYRASDGLLNDVATATITVQPVNDPPDAHDDAYTTDEDIALSANVLANDVDVDGLLTATLLTDVAHGTLAFNADGSFTYTPDANYFGPDSFTYRASDGTLDDAATVAITVNPVNDAPVAVDDSYATSEDTPLVVAMPGILGNDTDIDSASLEALLETGPAHGTLALNADGSFMYTPDANFNGTDGFSYRVSDDELSDIGAVSITVNPVNDSPVAADDSYATDEDTPLTIAAPGVLTNDSDVDLDALTAALVSGPAHGTLALNADGSFTYTPDANFNGTDGFTYRVSDDELSDIGAVSITVNAVNDKPVAADDSFTTDEDIPLTIAAPGVLANDSDVDLDALTAALVSGPAHGGLVLNPDGSFTYTPDANFNGTDGFTYRASDGVLGDTATVSITVNPVNDSPVAVDDSFTTDEDTTLLIAAPGVLANDADVDLDALNAALESGPTHGTLVLNADGSFSYTPDANYFGSDSFTYRVSDGAATDIGLVSIAVNAVNDAPVALDDSYSVDEDGSLAIPVPGVLGNDSDIDSTALEAALVAGPAHGDLSFSPDGSFTYTPHANFNGTDAFTYRVSDGALSDTGSVSITVNPVNDAPVAEDDAYSVDEDGVLALAAPGALANDTDVDLDALNAALESGPAHGSLAFNADGSFVYTPHADYFGADSFTYRVSDGALSDTGLVSITVNPVNDAPVARDDFYTIDEDTGLSADVLANDTDVDNASLTVTLLTDVSHGTLVLAADGTFSYTPNADFFGFDTFAYRASDGLLGDEATATITVLPVNGAPVAHDDAYAVNEDGVLSIAAPGVLANDIDADSPVLTAALLAGPAHGSLVFNSDGSFTYTPHANFFGSDTFTYSASDGSFSDSAAVAITVNAVNDAPVAADDAYTTNEDTPLVVAVPGVLGNDSDVDSASLEALLQTGPAHGTLALNADGSFTYTPDANFNGTDGFTYRVSDDELFDAGAVTITVNPVNDAPVAADDSYATNEDTPLVVAVPGILGNDSDIDSASLEALLETGPAHGTLALNADGSFTYTPDANFNGTDGLTYRVSDDELSDIGAVTITVNAVNDNPVAADDSFTTDEDIPLTIAAPGVLANDSDVDLDALTAALVSGPAHGGLVLNADGSFTYTPDANYFGPDSFTYRASDGALGDTATVSITVNPVNDAPVAADDSYATDEDTTLLIAMPGVLANDTDVDLDALNAALESGPAHGTLALNADGSFTYTPDANFNGTDGFTYRVSDDDLSDIGAVTITVNPVNDAPVAADDSYTTDEDTALTIAAPGLLANDSDVDLDTLAAALVSGPAHGALALNLDGNFIYTPDANFNGTDTFSYRVSDGDLSDTGQVFITVRPVNDTPVAADDSYSTNEDTPLVVAMPGILGNDSDIDSASLEALLETGPAHGSLALNADGSFTYTPDANFNGTDGFTYRVSDDELSDIGAVSITVNAVNDAPVAQDDSYSVDEDGVLALAMPGLLGNDTDVDLDALNAALESGPAHGSLALNADGSFTYTPDANFNGTDGFTYRVSDGELSDIGAVTITINPVNDAPVAFGDTATTDEDSAVTLNVLGNDDDIEDDTLTVVDATDGLNGTVVVNADGTVTYTPNANFYGSDVFSYVVSDGEETDDALVFVTVNPVNDNPDAFDDTAATTEDVPVTVAVLANDADIDGDTLTVAAVTQGAHGAVAANTDGSVTYTPNAGFDGSDSFTYTVNDGHGGSDTATVAVTVNAAGGNGAPVFTEIADRTVTEGTEVRFTISATDPDAGDTLVYMAADLPAGATFDAATREFRWVPADDAAATVTFTVLDSHGASDTMEVSLTATNVAATVDAGADQVVGLQKDGDDGDDDDGLPGGGRKVATADLHAAFNDLGTADTHTARINWGDGTITDGVVSESPFGPEGSTAGANGTIEGGHTYTKAGVYTVTVTVTDDNGGVRSDSMVVRVQKPDSHLKGKSDKYETVENAVLNVNAGSGVLSNDLGGGTLTARLVDGPEHGALTLNANGSFTYVPDADYHGRDVFYYEFNDGLNVSRLVKVELKVQDAPKIDWACGSGWGGLPLGKQQQNLVEFLLKLAAKRG